MAYQDKRLPFWDIAFQEDMSSRFSNPLRHCCRMPFIKLELRLHLHATGYVWGSFSGNMAPILLSTIHPVVCQASQFFYKLR